MPDTRKTPLVSVRLYDEGHGDPVVDDRGFAWLDLLQSSWPFGSTSYSGVEPTLELLEGIGLVNRPGLVLQDTRLSQYTFHAAADWAEERPATGSPRKYRLVQASAAANLQWHATSHAPLPENPHCAFTLFIPDTTPTHDATTYPPLVRLEFGRFGTQAQWAIEFSKNEGARLMRWGGLWVPVLSLDQPNGATRDVDEILVVVRCYRGRIGISMDGGRNYRWYGNADGSALTVAASPFILRGQGSQVVFGLHQLVYTTGVFTSPERNTFHARSVLASPVLSGRYDAPAGTSVTLADASSPLDALAQYQATLTPAVAGGGPFTFYTGPALYSVVFRYPVTTRLGYGSGTYTTPWDGRIRSVQIDKPRELAGGTCSVSVLLAPGANFSGNYRWRKIQVRLGWRLEDLSEQWWTAFTGYIESPPVEWESFGEVSVTLEARSVAFRFERTEWTALDVLALGGQQLNTAADYILYTEGLGASYRTWHALGTLPLDSGPPEDPFELLRPRERKWETLTRIMGYAGLELAATDTGGLLALPYNHVSGVTHAYRPDQGDRTNSVLRLRNRADYAESATAVLVYGRAPNGAPLLAWGVDDWAEHPAQIAQGRFCPWREVVQAELPGRCNVGMLIGKAAAMAGEYFPLQWEPEIGVFVNLDVGRRDKVTLSGAARLGIPDGTEYVVLSLQHTYGVDQDSGEYELATLAGLRRIS